MPDGGDGQEDDGFGEFVSFMSSMAPESTKKKAVAGLKERACKVFLDIGPTKLRKYIAVDYDYIENDIPVPMKSFLQQSGSMFAPMLDKNLTAEKVKGWMEEPSWLPEDSDVDPDRLKACAEVVNDEPGGEAWLERQVSELRSIAGVD